MEQNLNVPLSGMSFGSPAMVKNNEFLLLLNGKVYSSTTFALVTNDSSNLLITRFKEGYKVIGTYLVPSLSTTFFFLVNPNTNDSEIGFIYDASSPDKADATDCCDNNIVEQTPLELTEQVPLSTYYTFVNAKCLNFDIDHPVSSWIKIDDCNIRIYFNDFKNPPRYIDYKDFQKVTISNCPLIETNELDCDKIQIFPETCYPSIDAVEVIPGGQNIAGVYQFAICYADVRSNKLTDYFYVSNPVPLFDQPITVNTAYPVYKSLKLQINNLNTDFRYFNLVVIKTINNVSTPQLVETFEVNSSNFTYIYTGVDKNIQQDLSLDEILVKNPYYNKAKITTESNGYLMFTNLEEDRVLNLQPVVIDIPLRWQTVELNDGDYADPIIAKDYVGYLGDEVYAFGISFTKTNGKQTNVFPFVGRSSTPSDLEDVSCIICDTNTVTTCPPSGSPLPSGICKNSDVTPIDPCATESFNQRWRVYNTASDSGKTNCVIFDENSTPQEITDEVECVSNEVLINRYPIGSVLPDGTLPEIPPCPTAPVIYLYPPSGDFYPPESINDFNLLKQYLAQIGNKLGPISSNPATQSEQNKIGLCDCNTQFEGYPTTPPSGITSELDLTICSPSGYVENDAIEIITEESVFAINTYSNKDSKGNYLKAPNAIKYNAGSPSPCSDKDVSSEDDTPQYVAWIDQKQNWTALDAEYLAQSDSNKCELDTWGAFISLPTPTGAAYVSSWYLFSPISEDGVVAITISTDNITYGINVYEQNSNGLPGLVKTAYEQINADSPDTRIQTNAPLGSCPPYYTGIGTLTYSGSPPNYYYNNKDYYLFKLERDKQYFIEVRGYAEYDCPCKVETFRICVNTPKPTITTYTIVPGVAKITKTCKITYQGFPENNCKPKPHNYGDFAYWESQETYPCNEEVWKDLAGKHIRHFKFPDHRISPFFEESKAGVNKLSLKSNKIYPKGVRLDINDIKVALTKAVSLGLITEKEKSEICGYRVYRSNRRGNESIIAKGLLYDVWNYKDNVYNTGNRVLFPNFPFNDNSPNPYVLTKKIKKKSQVDGAGNLLLRHPNAGVFNDKYTFDAPNLSFNNPGLGTELKLECEQTGKAVSNFVELRNNTKYQYIGAAIISASIGFASIEAAFEGLNTMANATLTQSVLGTSFPLGLILAAIGENIMSPIRIYSHYSEWYDIIKKFAPFRNYAYYYLGTGKYVGYTSINTSNVKIGNTRRTIANAQYLKPGILNVRTTKGSTRFNNFKRDSSVFIELTNSFTKTHTEDKSRVLPNNCDFNLSQTSDICSYYGSLKNPLLSQYGQIDNIEWIDTGYNGRINWSDNTQNTTCDTIFGGDTYITRFTKKRKVPMFLEDRVIPSSATQVSPINQDIQLSLLSNIGYARYFMDYPTTFDYSGTKYALFGDVAVQSKTKVDYNFLCFSSTGKAWKNAGLAAAINAGFAAISFGIFSLPIAIAVVVSRVKKDLGNDLFLNGKYIHSFYGISSFLCESNYNLDYRHGENIKEKNFYPNVGDINEWTQEFFVPMYEDNYYFYNNDYSKQNVLNPNFVLNNDFKQTKEDCKVSHPNRLIYSLQDNDQNDKFDGNRTFLANNYYEFPKSGGAVNIVKGLENGKVLVVQENQASVFNSFISLETNIATSAVGSNTIFNKSIPAQYVKSDLGFGGSQTNACITTEFGTYWVDNKRAQIINLGQGIDNIIKPEEEWWFKENLPFHILEDFPDFDVTNNFKDVGMSIVYDARFKRVIFTKRDVKLKQEYRGLTTYDGSVFKYKNETFTVTADKYFCNKSWTISYSPILKSFISFHSFTPNYYIGNQTYFLSGTNYTLINDTKEEGLWGHNLTNKSYQVYQGNLYPFMFQYAIPTKYSNNMLESIRYNAQFYRYQDNISSGLVPNVTYNKAIIWNFTQSTGMLELVPKIKNDRRQSYEYASGKQNANSRSILVEFVERGWQFNNFYDVSIENSKQPLMSYQCDNIAYQEINPLSISYAPKFIKRKMVSDYHIIRLINDKYSNYSIQQRYSVNQTNNINN